MDRYRFFLTNGMTFLRVAHVQRLAASVNFPRFQFRLGVEDLSARAPSAVETTSGQEARHAASRENPGAGEYPVSHQLTRSQSDGAHSGLYTESVSVPRAGALWALMASGRSRSGTESINRIGLSALPRRADESAPRSDSRERPAGEVAQPGSAPSESSEGVGSNPTLTAGDVGGRHSSVDVVASLNVS